MIIKQLSVFLENKQGRLCAATDIIAKSGVDISALSLADTAEFGILRLIVDQPERAQEALRQAGIVVSITRVVAVAMDDVPGGAVGILNLFSRADLNVEYMYACVGRVSGQALMVVRTDDVERAETVLQENGFNHILPTDIYRI